MRRWDNERGLVLLWVLVVVALLTSLLVEFAFSTLVDLRLTETFRDSTKAYYLAKGGVTAGRMILQQDDNSYDAADEMWSQGVEGMPVGDGHISVRIKDLDGRLDLNRLVWQANDNPNSDFLGRFERLATQLGLERPSELAAALIDWIDRNDEPYSGVVTGAESNYYLFQDPPYLCKNGPLDTVEELALVRGFDEETVRILAPHVTVHGSSTININTATAEVLLAWPSELVDFSVIEDMIARRKSEPFEKLADLKPDFQAWYDVVAPIDSNAKVKSETYRIRSLAQVNDGSRTVEAVVEKPGDALLYWKVD